MLYISRYVHPQGYGVVDTDDDTEEVVTREDIYLVCCALGIKVRGVILETDDTGFTYVAYAGVYQPAETQTQLQIKTRLLRHVEVLVYKSMITHIRWSPNDIKEPVTIRLSDFGTTLADYCLTSIAPAGCHKVTLIIDDKIQFSEKGCFFATDMSVDIGVRGLGVVLDLREMTNDAVVRQLYKIMYDGDFARLFDSLLDTPERMERMIETWGVG